MRGHHFLDSVRIDSIRVWDEFEQDQYLSWLLDFDATNMVDYPEDPDIGYVYVLGLSDGWVKVGKTWQWESRRSRQLVRQIRRRHGLEVEQVWKTPPLTSDYHDVEQRVLRFARSIRDDQYLYYEDGGTRRCEDEMFHGADFGLVRAYADCIGRCEVEW